MIYRKEWKRLFVTTLCNVYASRSFLYSNSKSEKTLVSSFFASRYKLEFPSSLDSAQPIALRTNSVE